MNEGGLRGLAALSGFGLILSAFVMAYLNSTTENFVWSMIYVAGIVVTSLAASAKWSTALGVSSGLVTAADAVSSFVPWVCLYFVGLQALHFKHDGFDGFMAGVSIITLTFLIAFGVMDSLMSWFGGKYSQLRTAAEETSRRMDAVRRAAAGQ